MLMHRNGLKTPNEVLKAVTPANASDLCHPRGDSQRLMQNSLQVRMSMSRDWWYFAMIELNCTTKSSSCWCLICAIMGSTNYRSFPLVPADTHHVHKHSREFVEASFVWGDMHVSFPRSTNHCEIATHSWTLGAGSLLIPESRCWAFLHLACILLLYLVVLKNPQTCSESYCLLRTHLRRENCPCLFTFLNPRAGGSKIATQTCTLLIPCDP